MLGDAKGTYRNNVVQGNKRRQFIAHPALLQSEPSRPALELSSNIIGGGEGVTASIVTLAQQDTGGAAGAGGGGPAGGRQNKGAPRGNNKHAARR